MFEKIVIRRHRDFVDLIDVGTILEATLYYDNVHMVFDTSTLIQLGKAIGLSNLVALLRDKIITGSLFWDYFAVMDSTRHGLVYTNPVCFQARGDQKHSKLTDREHLLKLIERQFGKSRENRKHSNAILDLVPIRDLKKNDTSTKITEASKSDMLDSAYLINAANIFISKLAPGIDFSDKWHLTAVQTDDGFLFDSNIDFAYINRFRKNLLEKEGVVDPLGGDEFNRSHILSMLVNARADMFFCADYMAEFMSTESTAELMRFRFAEALRHRSNRIDEIELFQEVTLGDSRAIREVINSGERSISEFLKLLNSARRFKSEFLKIANPDEGLIREYQAALTRETWADKLPSKLKRFSFFAAAGLLSELVLQNGLSSIAATGLTAIDDLIVDKLLKGWRPNQFVDGPLKDFVKGS